eukprot:evm.model.scf_143.4 EVM.evm.TU.scf_143.4   scf_143:69045-74105(-)
MAALRRLAGPSMALTLWVILLLVAPTAARPLDQPHGRSLSQVNVTTTDIPFLTDLTPEDLEGEWAGQYKPNLVPVGRMPNEEICLSDVCRDAFPAGNANVTFSVGGRMVTIDQVLPAALPSPPGACQEEGLAESGRAERTFRASGNVSSYTPAGNMAVFFSRIETTGDIGNDMPEADENNELESCVKFRAYVGDAGAVKAEVRIEERFQGTMAEFTELLQFGGPRPRCFVPSVDLDITTCQILLDDPENFFRSVMTIYDLTCNTGKCLDIAARG